MRPTLLLRPALLGLLTLPALAQGQIAPCPSFDGVFEDGFETQHLNVGGSQWGFEPCLVDEVFGGVASLCSSLSGGVLVSPMFINPANCIQFAHTGEYFSTTVVGYLVLEFDRPMRRFGAHLSTHYVDAATTEVNFFDASGSWVGGDVVDHGNDCQWSPFAWEAAEPFTRVTLEYGTANGSYVMLDELHADPWPGFGGWLGQPSCTSTPNSTGQVAQLEAFGSAVAARDDLTLMAWDLPPGAFGIFLSSRLPGVVVGPGGSPGVLCLAPPIGRWASAVAPASPNGFLQLQLDLASMPNASPAAVQPGETWYFQCWFRDTPAGAASHFSSSVAVVFQ